MTAPGVGRGVLAALIVYAVVLIVALLPSRPFDPLEDEATLLVFVVAASLIASAAGAVAGAWQARAGGVRSLLAALAVGVVTVVAAGVLLTAAEGGGNEASETALVYAAHPVGALLGAIAWARRAGRRRR